MSGERLFTFSLCMTFFTSLFWNQNGGPYKVISNVTNVNKYSCFTSHYRYESLDNLHNSNSVSKLSSPSQAAQWSSVSSSTVPYRGFSGRCSLGPNAVIFSTSFQQSPRHLSGFTSTTVSSAASKTSSNSLQNSKYGLFIVLLVYRNVVMAVEEFY